MGGKGERVMGGYREILGGKRNLVEAETTDSRNIVANAFAQVAPPLSTTCEMILPIAKRGPVIRTRTAVPSDDSQASCLQVCGETGIRHSSFFRFTTHFVTRYYVPLFILFIIP